MPPHDSKNRKLLNSTQINDGQLYSIQQQSQEASLPTSLTKQNISKQSTFKNNHKIQQSSFIDDLVKMIQISLIVVLVLFVCMMGYAIINQTKEFWFRSQALEVSMSTDIKRDEPMIKMQIAQNNDGKKEDDSENIHLKEDVSTGSEKLNYQQKQLELALSGETNQNRISSKIQSQRLKDQQNQNIVAKETVELKQNSDQNVISQAKQSTVQGENKNVQQQNININQNEKSNFNNLKSQAQKKIDQDSKHVAQQKPFKADTKKKPLAQISAHTVIPADKKQLYDPVLVQIDKMRKKAGKNYRETIYTMRNTQIGQQQYKMAKELIEITQYYNPRTKKFNVKNSQISLYKCGQLDPQCEIKQKQVDNAVSNEKKYYLNRYRQAWRSITQQLPFCIIVPSYKNNHANNIFKNLNSIFQQQYSNYHVVYIDDNSKDGTSAKVKNYRTTYGIDQKKLTLLVNQENQRALSNIYRAAHYYCQKKQIMLIVDGDDYLIGTQVFKLLNFQYQTKQLLAAYTNYLRINEPYYVKVGTSTPYPKSVIDKRTFRKNFSIFRASHLRSFYVDLFRKIKQSDLKDAQGKFFTAANDFAIMMPILEMAAPHIQYIPQLTYLYDSGTGLNNFQSKQGVQAANAKIIAKRNEYPQVNIKEFYEKKY